MSALYYVTEVQEKKTYYIGTANNARTILFDLVLNNMISGNDVVLFSENSSCEDEYLSDDYQELNMAYCGFTETSIDNFYKIFEALQGVKLERLEFLSTIEKYFV